MFSFILLLLFWLSGAVLSVIMVKAYNKRITEDEEDGIDMSQKEYMQFSIALFFAVFSWLFVFSLYVEKVFSESNFKSDFKKFLEDFEKGV